MKISNETKTGIFVLVCLVALGALLIKVGNFNFFKKGYMVQAKFQFSGGVKENAPVRLSGVDIGEVKRIRLLYEPNQTAAELDLWIEEGTKIRTDAVALVATLGLMGEKYVEIRPGTKEEFIAPDGHVQTEEPARLEDLVDLGKKVASDIGQTAKDISKVANHIDEAIQENRPKIDNIFDNLEDTSENFNDFSQDVKFHPWKVLAKGKEAPKDVMLREREQRHLDRAKKRGKQYTPNLDLNPAPVAANSDAVSGKSKSNFSPAR